MNVRAERGRRLTATLGLCILIGLVVRAAGVTNDPWTVDFRYAPSWWQTSICLPDDWQKTLVGKNGSLLYDYPGPYSGFGTKIGFGLTGDSHWEKQELVSPRVPIVRTIQRNGNVEIVQETFAAAPLLTSARQRTRSPSLCGWIHTRARPVGRRRLPELIPASAA